MCARCIVISAMSGLVVVRGYLLCKFTTVSSPLPLQCKGVIRAVCRDFRLSEFESSRKERSF